MLPRLAFLPTALILGCSATPPAPPPTPSAPSATAVSLVASGAVPPASASAPAPSASALPLAAGQAYGGAPGTGGTGDAAARARVTSVVVKDGGAKAKIEFTNASKRPCRFMGYKLSWGSSHKDIKLETLVVPPGETRERWLLVQADEGDLTALTPAGSRVEVQVECGGT